MFPLLYSIEAFCICEYVYKMKCIQYKWKILSFLLLKVQILFFISVSLLQFPITTLPSAPSLSYPEPSVSHLSLCSVVISCCPHASPIERVYGLSISIYFSINPSSWSLNGTLHSALFQCCTDNSHTAHTQFITFMHPCGLME